MGIDEVAIGRIFQAVDTIENATQKITAALYERDGLVERTLKIEEAAKRLKEEADAVKDFRTHTTEVLDRIEKSVETHHADKELHTVKGLCLKLPIIGGLFLFVAFVHTIIPPTLNLWDLVSKLLGL